MSKKIVKLLRVNICTINNLSINVQLSVFCNATEKYLSSDRDMYRKELENEIDVLEDVIDMDIDSSKVYDCVGKFLPMKIVLRSRIPVKWETSETFRKQI